MQARPLASRVVAMRDERWVMLDPREIRFAEADRNNVWLRTDRGPLRAATRGLDRLEQQLEGKGFLRVHRRFLVNLSRIREIEPASRERCSSLPTHTPTRPCPSPAGTCRISTRRSACRPCTRCGGGRRASRRRDVTRSAYPDWEHLNNGVKFAQCRRKAMALHPGATARSVDPAWASGPVQIRRPPFQVRSTCWGMGAEGVRGGGHICRSRRLSRDIRNCPVTAMSSAR
jgi:hypothetical protein